MLTFLQFFWPLIHLFSQKDETNDWSEQYKSKNKFNWTNNCGGCDSVPKIEPKSRVDWWTKPKGKHSSADWNKYKYNADLPRIFRFSRLCVCVGRNRRPSITANRDSNRRGKPASRSLLRTTSGRSKNITLSIYSNVLFQWSKSAAQLVAHSFNIYSPKHCNNISERINLKRLRNTLVIDPVATANATHLSRRPGLRHSGRMKPETPDCMIKIQ